MRPIMLFPRMDFMYYAFDQIINHAANWHYMFGGKISVPLTVWCVVNRGGEQAAQHSQSIQAMFAHVPGLKVVMPSTASDAKGLMAAAVEDDNPVIYIDERWLYNHEGEVSEELYSLPIGKGIVRKEGTDMTLIASSFMVTSAMEAAGGLESEGISVEVIDLRSVKPLDEALILDSLRKTGRLAIADGGWKSYGIGAEISAIAVEQAFGSLKAPVLRIALPDAPAPASRTLEECYYPDADRIKTEIRGLLKEK
jgi:pyruvate dehydrogenase E1 component beta subunit